MRLPGLFRIRKSRKYPIKRDGEGLSLRARCFELFAQGKRPTTIAEELKMMVPTVCRYFRDWKRLGPNFELQYAYVKGLFKKTAPDRGKNIELFAKALGIEKERLETILSQSHGLRRLMTRKYYFPAHAEADHKRHMALELALLISDHLTINGGKFEDFYFALRRYMQENMKYREEEDADIKEENKLMKMTHAVLAADMENERKGRIKPDRLSEQECSIIMRYGIETEMKKAVNYYWHRIDVLKAEGLTPEQAREKIYQDLVNKGDLKGAKMIREFQDKVHPLGKNDQVPPLSSLQPPSPT